MGGTVIARYEVEITSGTIPTNPQTPPTYTVNYSPGIDIGAGIGAVGGDLEVTYNPNLGGYNVESSTAVGGWVLNQTFSGGVNGFGWGFQGGVGGIWGNPLINGEVFTGVEGGIEINIKTGDITVRQGGVVEGSKRRVRACTHHSQQPTPRPNWCVKSRTLH